MITNNDIQTELFDQLEAANLGYPIAYPGVDFTPPDSGIWLEVSFFPAEPRDDALADDDSIQPQGNYQVAAVTRPGAGIVGLTKAAQAVQDAYPRGQTIIAPVRVSRHPYQMQRIDRDDRMMIPVTIPYSA